MALGGVHRTAGRDHHGRYPLRDQMVEARYDLERCASHHPAGDRRDRGPVPDRLVRRWLHHEPRPGRCERREGLGRLRVRRPAVGSRAWRPREVAGPAPVLLEKCEVGARPDAGARRPAWLLGDLRLPQPRRPMAGAALPRRLTWQLATVVELVDETPRCRSLVLDPPAWPGHRAGQHVDVRLTADDGYQAERSYSIASAPEDGKLVLTVERLEDGEVSPYLTDELRPGDELELRGP